MTTSCNLQKEQLKKMYKDINEHYLIYEPIANRDLLDLLVKRINEIDELYYKYAIDDKYKNEKFRNHFDLTAVTKKIVMNKDMPTPCTLNTVLSILTGIYKWTCWYLSDPQEFERKRLFNDANYATLCLTRVYNFVDVEDKKMLVVNQGDLMEKINQFLSISDEEIIKCISLCRFKNS